MNVDQFILGLNRLKEKYYCILMPQHSRIDTSGLEYDTSSSDDSEDDASDSSSITASSDDNWMDIDTSENLMFEENVLSDPGTPDISNNSIIYNPNFNEYNEATFFLTNLMENNSDISLGLQINDHYRNLRRRLMYESIEHRNNFTILENSNDSDDSNDADNDNDIDDSDNSDDSDIDSSDIDSDSIVSDEPINNIPNSFDMFDTSMNSTETERQRLISDVFNTVFNTNANDNTDVTDNLNMGEFFNSQRRQRRILFPRYRYSNISNITRSNFGKLYCYSFATAFFIYVVVNMGMVLGLLPIVGSPLPIMSYGGSSMMAIMLGLGIAMSCKIYKDTPVN